MWTDEVLLKQVRRMSVVRGRHDLSKQQSIHRWLSRALASEVFFYTLVVGQVSRHIHDAPSTLTNTVVPTPEKHRYVFRLDLSLTHLARFPDQWYHRKTRS